MCVLTFAVRFWGWSENEREQEMAKEESAKGTVPGFGQSNMTEEMQGAAHRNSIFSQLNLGMSFMSVLTR